MSSQPDKDRPDDGTDRPTNGGPAIAGKCSGDGSDVPDEDVTSPDAQAIFDERFRLFTDQFGATCEREGVRTAIAIVLDPKSPQQPLVFVRGDEYDAAKLIAILLRKLRHDIISSISV